jgi:hypothetical protein
MLIPQDFRGRTPFDAAGRFFSYTEHTSPGTVPGVRLWVEGQPVGIIHPGQTFEVDEDCRRWEVVPIDPACTGQVLIGYGRMHTGRIVGPVDSTTSLADSRSGKESFACGYRAPGAGLFAALGINAQTRALAVRSAVVIAAGATGFNVHKGTGGLCTAPTGTRGLVNKLTSGPAATGLIQYFDAAALSGPITGVTLGPSFFTGTLQGQQLISGAPLILVPGESLWVIATTANVAHMFAIDATEL